MAQSAVPSLDWIRPCIYEYCIRMTSVILLYYMVLSYIIICNILVYTRTYWQLTRYFRLSLTNDTHPSIRQRGHPTRTEHCLTVTNIWSWAPVEVWHQDTMWLTWWLPSLESYPLYPLPDMDILCLFHILLLMTLNLEYALFVIEIIICLRLYHIVSHVSIC
jgi:hypothetical protein